MRRPSTDNVKRTTRHVLGKDFLASLFARQMGALGSNFSFFAEISSRSFCFLISSIVQEQKAQKALKAIADEGFPSIDERAHPTTCCFPSLLSFRQAYGAPVYNNQPYYAPAAVPAYPTWAGGCINNLGEGVECRTDFSENLRY